MKSKQKNETLWEHVRAVIRQSGWPMREKEVDVDCRDEFGNLIIVPREEKHEREN